MRRRWGVIATVLAFAALRAAAACTTFDGLVAAPDAAAVDAAVDVDAGPVPTTYLGPADAARACSLIFRCPLLASSILQSMAVPIDRTNYSLCMDWLSGPVPNNRVGIAIQSGVFQCIAKATSCQAAGECLSLENFGPGDPRCADAGPGDAGQETCIDDGGTVLRCAGQYALHCGSAYYSPGSRCFVGSDQGHWCAINSNCTTSTSCIGSLLDYCGAGGNLHEGVNCAASGYTCGVDPDAGGATCLTATTVEACMSVGSDCAGDAIAACDGFQISRFDCSALGGTCSKKGGPAHCVRTTDTCSSFDPAVNACSGTRVSLCIAGAPASFDCATIGASCVPGAGAQSGHCG